MKEVHYVVLLLLVTLISVYGKFLVLGPDDPVVATAGEDALLECQLVPDISVRNMVVKWLKSGLDSPVHVYRNGKDDIVAQHRDYRGRTELFKDELTKGNISLRIKNTTVFDEGGYTCFVDDKTKSETFTLTLEVVGFGCEPWIQMKGYVKNGIELVCKSNGWFPEPVIQWINEDGHNLIQSEAQYQKDSKGLVNVQRNIVITRESKNKLTCRIRNGQLNTEQDVTVRISDDMFPAVPDWLVPLLISICLLIVAISALIYWNVKQNPRIEELELWKSIVELEWKRICECEGPDQSLERGLQRSSLLSEVVAIVRELLLSNLYLRHFQWLAERRAVAAGVTRIGDTLGSRGLDWTLLQDMAHSALVWAPSQASLEIFSVNSS
ncbi:butyrophilin subfamily 3 member A2-like isoform X4 [Carcharodon carcharias]|uniref:butyrophilin subfamily 3 member A2-like isoform X4 n=1 Tax=Carcharodon carcharias TaxID=13397 RepID=UPI001B7F4FDF|nr:butyrophilin subfamily 3 member A2-like isoform X4 [Carcharodon carcharias]